MKFWSFMHGKASSLSASRLMAVSHSTSCTVLYIIFLGIWYIIQYMIYCMIYIIYSILGTCYNTAHTLGLRTIPKKSWNSEPYSQTFVLLDVLFENFKLYIHSYSLHITHALLEHFVKKVDLKFNIGKNTNMIHMCGWPKIFNLQSALRT